jgi:hypothetical protein
MTIAVAMLLLGALFLYGGWNNLSIASLLRGDNQTPKPKVAKKAGT